MKQIELLLAEMGRSQEEVAELLRTEGIRGRRDSTSFNNPIVRYVNRNLDVGAKLEVGGCGTLLRIYEGKVTEMELPLPVQRFLRNFQQGMYPDLEDR